LFDRKTKKGSVKHEMQSMEFDMTTYKEVFGKKPNKNNLKTFFGQPEIQFLWQEFYMKRPSYRAWKQRFS